MQGYAQTVARLNSMKFLLQEALRIADEGGSALVGAKISDCVDWIEQELASAEAADSNCALSDCSVADPA